MLKQHIAALFPGHMKREIKELYFSTIILGFGVMMIQLFEPIYLYQIGYDLRDIIGFFVIVYAVYFCTLPLGLKFAQHYGYEKSIVISSVILIIYYAVLYLIDSMPALFFIAPIINALYRTFYWPAFHADFARYMVQDEEGREVGGFYAAISLVSVFAPLAAGVILQFWGFAALFTFASFLFLLSNIPLLVTKELLLPQKIRYGDIYKDVFSKKNRRSFMGYLGFGEEAIGMIVWPVFIAVVIVELINVGAVVSIATLVSLIITIGVGRIVDKKNKEGILRYGSVLLGLSWFGRLFVRGAWGVFFIDSWSRVAKRIVEIPLTAITYDRAQKLDVLRGIGFFEMTLVFAKLATLTALFILLFFVPDATVYQTSFVLAGLMTFFYMFL